MSVAYRAVGWTGSKKVYDTVLVAGVVGYLAIFLGVDFVLRPNTTAETAIIRAAGTCALLLLHVILAIGPLARLDRRFLPLLYNRRHLGVTMFLLALIHGGFSVLQFHAFGDVHPIVSVLTSNGRYDSVTQFPFQVLGLAALGVLFLMAATSHDFWLANLSAPVWKALHMMVYPAYGLLVLHVAMGVLQAETHGLLAGLLVAGCVTIFGLHIAAGLRERAADQDSGLAADSAGFVPLCAPGEIGEDLAKIFLISGERIAVYRYEGKISAISNVCQHQNGPLGEGRIIDGCVTCPWHGYQYLPDSGSSPPPFTEKIPTFRVKIADGRVWVHPRPNPPGTPVEPAVWSAEEAA